MPLLPSTILFASPTDSTGLHPFSSSPAQLEQDEREQQDVAIWGSSFKRTRISLELNVLTIKPALVPSSLPLERPPGRSGGGPDLPPPILWAFALFSTPKPVKAHLTGCASLSMFYSHLDASRGSASHQILMTDGNCSHLNISQGLTQQKKVISLIVNSPRRVHGNRHSFQDPSKNGQWAPACVKFEKKMSPD